MSGAGSSADGPVACERCGRRFADADLLALHRGQAHAGSLTADERSAHAAALEREDAALRRYRLQALGAVVVLYFLLLFAYALVG